jgi:hypothetical protein
MSGWGEAAIAAIKGAGARIQRAARRILAALDVDGDGGRDDGPRARRPPPGDRRQVVAWGACYAVNGAGVRGRRGGSSGRIGGRQARL